MKVLVTGGAGFIGSHIVDALRARNDDVICIDSLDPGVHRAAPEYLRDDVDYCFADLRHWRPDSRFDNVEVVIHLAALGGVSRASREPDNVIGANCSGTAKLVEAAHAWKDLRAIVLASSFSVYGSGYVYRCRACGAERTGARRTSDLERGEYEVACDRCGSVAEVLPITTTSSPAPLETYGASKYMQELCFRGFEHAPVHIMRFSSVYGTRLRLDDGEATIIAKLAGWIGNGYAPTLFEDGQQIRDWVYVGDVVDTALALSKKSEASQLLNVCSGVPTTLLEACDVLSEALARDDIRAKVVGGFRPGDMRHCLGDAEPLAELLGRRPVAFRDGARLAFGGHESSLSVR
ncbi:MAG TPA: NAD-dependent epimerase/dehydratase family protein [Gemmatimonadaceae bacterium]|nr:NAD-dependent epimerase/dehydratase family protein [Gemmatimonadaceae bacterium]